MRNNLLMGLTGWGFGTFNNFHRWIARIATLQAVIHSIGYTIIVYRSAPSEPFVEWAFANVYRGRVAVFYRVLGAAVLVDG